MLNKTIMAETLATLAQAYSVKIHDSGITDVKAITEALTAHWPKISAEAIVLHDKVVALLLKKGG